MEETYVIKNSEGVVPEVISDSDAQAARKQVIAATSDFKNSWRNLACALNVVWINKLYKQWGYENFDSYTEKEVRIRKHTAMKLIRSYQFLEQEEPKYLRNGSSAEEESALPSLEAVSTLQRAKKQLSEDDYKQVKQYLLKEHKDPCEVKKDLTALIMKGRKDVDHEEERTKRNKVAVDKFLETLRSFKRDIELSGILPAVFAQDMDVFIDRIEEYISQD